LTGYDRLKIVAQLPPPSTVELAPKIKAVEVRVAETGNKNVPSSTKVQKSMPNGPQMAVKKSEIILPNKKGLQNPTETDKLNQQRQQLQHQINPPPKRLLAPPPLLTKKLSVTGSLLPANRLPPMNYNSLESSSSFVQQIVN
jgi:hypothetical protein